MTPTPNPPESDPVHRAHMQAALRLAARGLGETWPNPSVGCVIVAADGRVIGRGRTQRGGRPHAETQALDMARTLAPEAIKGATAYVTLEPCAHTGKTPPCAAALIDAGIGTVFSALHDPDPRVQGGGHAMLRAAGIVVHEGLCEPDAADINTGFLKRLATGHPMVSLKLATSLDGRIATASGHSQWITGSQAREAGHLLRAAHDAILVGSGTVLADDPTLTCRLPGLEGRSPVRVILDRRLRTPLGAKLVQTAREVPTWLVCSGGADPEKRRLSAEAGVEILKLEGNPGDKAALDAALLALGNRGLTRILIEGGAGVAASALRTGQVDRLEWFRAGLAIGADGRPALEALGVDRLDDAARWQFTAQRRLGRDTHETWRPM